MSNLKAIILLSIAHFITDVNQGALPAMLPFFKAEYNLSYTAAAAIVFATNSTSAIVQPLFGIAADRFSKIWLLPLSLLIAGIGMGLTGISGSYAAILCLTVLSGIGIAAFHPQTARLVNFAAGTKKGTAMSFFGLGGTFGFAVGPILATSSLLTWGLTGSIVLIFPVSLMALILASQLPKLSLLEKTAEHANGKLNVTQEQDRWAAFSLLSVMVMSRSVIFFGLITFIPLYWTGYFNRSIAEGGFALATLTMSGVVGNFCGGWISDRIGRKKTIILAFLLLAVVLPTFLLLENSYLGFLLLSIIGFSHSATYSPSIVMGQEYLPNHVGFSSGVTLGMAVAFGGIAAPFIGKIADLNGIWYAMATIAVFPLFNVLLAFFLPRIQQTKALTKD